jgi:hypothetical protein
MKHLPLLLLLLIFAIIFSRCESSEEKQERITKNKCSSCHLFPEPALLDKKTWQNGVLPEMRFRMGLDMAKLWEIPKDEMPEVLKTLPSMPMATEEEWNAIVQYYTSNSPDSLITEQQVISDTLNNFSVSEFHFARKYSPLITLIDFDPESKKTFVASRNSKLYQLGQNLVLEDSIQLTSPASQILLDKNRDPIVVTLGKMDPNDLANGKVSKLNWKNKKLSTLIDSIKRPVFSVEADLNNDQQNDLIVAAFGNFSGSLSVYENQNSIYTAHRIHPFPGTRNFIIKDIDKNGFLDIITLITQGDEQINIYYNKGNFLFEQKILLRFPPVYGSSYFDMEDINNDGYDDIIYSNGDNADYSSILKPYHGVRIFINDGKNNYTQSWFYPMNGATQVLAQDFDNDGDIDLAAISFFSNFKNPDFNNFIYWENTDSGFHPSITPLSRNGRWLVMEHGDIDSDGDQDILLGALNFKTEAHPDVLNNWEKEKTAILILENKTR